MNRVLIVNSDGLLAALPTSEEYSRLDYTATNCTVLGVVTCNPDQAAIIYRERARVRVLLDGYPRPGEVEGEWLWVSVVQGEVVLL